MKWRSHPVDFQMFLQDSCTGVVGKNISPLTLDLTLRSHVCLWVDLAKLVPWVSLLKSNLLGT